MKSLDTLFLALLALLHLTIYILITSRMPRIGKVANLRLPRMPTFDMTLLRAGFYVPETSRATGGQCFWQIEGRPLDMKSAGQTVSYGEKMGLRYLDVKIYDVLDGLRKCAKILSY